MTKFQLNEVEQKRLKEFQEKVKKKKKKYGLYTFSFTPTGIGYAVEVMSHETLETINITDYDSW